MRAGDQKLRFDLVWPKHKQVQASMKIIDPLTLLLDKFLDKHH